MKRIRVGMATTDVEHRFGPPSRKIESEDIDIWVYDQGRIQDMFYSIHVAFEDSRVSQVYLGIAPCAQAVATEEPTYESGAEPFMEHPCGEFKNAIAAMEDAVCRLRALPDWDKWITFCAQGENPDRPGTIKFAEANMLGNRLDVGSMPLELELIARKAKIPASTVAADGNYYSVDSLSPCQVAAFLDAIFRVHFGIRPFADEGTDYAVGAEW
jgi:hypothetical protein